MIIAFDMDNTIADLYNVDNWLEKLRAEDTSPYLECRPLIDMRLLNQMLASLRKLGHTVEIISWTSKGGSKEYNKAVRAAKIDWLSHMGILNNIDHIHIVKYGTNKNCVGEKGEGILFDDSAEVREKWTRGEAIDPTSEHILTYLSNLQLGEN